MKAIRQNRHPLAMRNTPEISTGALIKRGIENFDLPKLETVARDLEKGIANRTLPPWAESTLEQVKQSIARKRAEDLFSLPNHQSSQLTRIAA